MRLPKAYRLGAQASARGDQRVAPASVKDASAWLDGWDDMNEFPDDTMERLRHDERCPSIGPRGYQCRRLRGHPGRHQE